MKKRLTALGDHFRARPIKPSEIALFLLVVFYATFHASLPEDLPITQSAVGDGRPRSLGKLTPPTDFRFYQVDPDHPPQFD